MNWEQIEGQWQSLKGRVREKWAKFTDDDLELISGKKDRLLGKLKERYGFEKDHAEGELDNFIDSLGPKEEQH